MKTPKYLTVAALSVSFLAGPSVALAGDQKDDPKLKPYTLKNCIVSGEKLGEMGQPMFISIKAGRLNSAARAA